MPTPVDNSQADEKTVTPTPRYTTPRDLTELVVIGFGFASAWCLSPLMAGWERTGRSSIRVVSAVIAAAILATATMIPLLIQIAVTRLPQSAVPKSDVFEVQEYTRGIVYPVMTNVCIVASIGMTFVALLGRLLGGALALGVYAALLVAGGRAAAVLGYWVVSPAEGHPAPVRAAAFVMAATFGWWKTGGVLVRVHRWGL